MATKRRIPVPVAVVVTGVLGGSHRTLETLFQRSGVPGDPPDLSHATKWKTWLLRCNDDPSVDPLGVLGRLLEEFMEVEPGGDDLVLHQGWIAGKERVEQALAKFGFRYRVGGQIVEVGTGAPGQSLASALKRRDFAPLEIEFERAISAVQTDPPSAVTAACSLLEALCRAYLEAHDLPLPDKQSIKPLWAVVQRELGLDPKDQSDQDVLRVLGGLASIVDGTGAFRTHAGSAHGGGKYRYRVQPRHARLVVNAAQSLATFVIETWELKEPNRLEHRTAG